MEQSQLIWENGKYKEICWPVWTELVCLRAVEPARVIIYPQGAGCIVVDRLPCLVIYLSVCGSVPACMCVQRSL